LAARAEKYGAKIYEHSPALKWSEHWVKTRHGTIIADKVIVAIETETSFSRPHSKNAQVIVTKPLNPGKLGWKSGHMLWETVLNYPAVRFWDNRLMISKEIAHNAKARQRKRYAQQLVKTLMRFFPMLAKKDLVISHSWECKVVHSPRRIFTILHKNGVYYPYGCAGNGLTHGTLAGKILADHFSGKKLPDIYVSSSKIRLSGGPW
ncbi:MAG: NAD(P)/FAD-dependent oxidoreductase, partial [Nitrososphaerales archaeon]